MRMSRLAFVPLAALLVALAVIGFASAQDTPPTGGTMHPMIPELQGVPKDQMFDQFRGAQFTVADQQGNEVTYLMTAGTVASVSNTSISVTPNGGSTASAFTTTANTRVHAMPAAGSLQAVAPGDKVVVMSRQGSDEAVMIGKHPKGGMGRFYHGM